MVQADSSNTYQFSKISQKSISTYQFVQIPHSTGVPQAIYDNIQLYGYEIYGLCTQDGLLDYVVGLDQSSNELRVMRIYNDTTSNTQFVKDYKKVDKNDTATILQGTVYVDCQYQGKYKDVNTYTIGIAGTYFHSNQISSYYLAKFSTKYNFTEYFAISENPHIMEAARGVKVDLDNKMVYAAVEINKQVYFNRTVYQPGDSPGIDNANVAIHGYSWTHGVREWTTVIGNKNYTDAFGRMRNYGNYLYVFLNSFSGQYSTNTSQTDIYYYRIRASNGYIEGQKIFGSPMDDRILELDMTFTGIYILAQINDKFLPHKENDKMWGTSQQSSNLVVIWMSYNDYIIDIEGYAFNEVVSPFPMKLFVPRTTSTTQTFVFIAPRTNDQIDANGGFMITYLNDSTLYFSQNLGCGSTCQVCNPLDTSYCIQCKTGYYMFENSCYPDACPQFTYLVYDEQGNSLGYCRRCHYSCMTCSGPNSDQCTSCCQNNTCGPIYNRVPNLGKCQCPIGLIDSNGYCVQRCTLNLAGKSNQLCYPQCPGNSFPSIRYDNPTQAQERSQYDSSSQTDCSQSAYHLRFSSTGKGLALQGQPDITQVPKEFTIGFWVRPMTLNTNSYFVNAYNRIQVKAVSATSKVQFIYVTGTSTTVEPAYTNDARQKVTLNTWNYVVVSQREYLSSTIMKYEQQLAIANSNMGIIQSGGYDNSKAVVYYPKFSNTIYIGGYSDQSPQSFTGYMKEFKFFTKYHGIAQIQDEQLRMYRYYSYDDPNLVAYWKFTEPYGSSDTFYVINDYSISQNQISYSRLTNPDYPQFVYDQSSSLSLCIFHDVAICQTLLYKQTYPYVIDGKRLTSLPTFNLADSPTLTKQNGDQVWFVPDNKPCLFSNALAYMTYQTNFINNWVVPDSTMSPVNLIEGNHYQVCYYIAQTGVAFNMYQQYIINKPKTVDPSNSDAYMADGVLRTWNTYEGDQSYGDVIKFALDCSKPFSTDYEMMRNNKPTYGQQTIKSFAQAGDYNLCWQHTYIQEQADLYYEQIHGMRFRIVGVPSISPAARTSVNMNEDLTRFDLQGAFSEGDKLAYSWKGNPITDCNPQNFVGQQYTRVNYNWPSIWFGYTSGIYGIQNYTMDELHMCYMSNAKDAPTSWSRIKKTTGNMYWIQVKEYTLTTLNGKCPEPISFTPTYGSTELYETDNTIKFQFKSMAVYPSLQSNGQPGKIAIYRGAITPDGKLIKTSELLWFNYNLNDTITPNPFQQGDLICSSSGACSIILSQQVNKMKGGEIYYLSFYKESFAYKTSSSSTTKYYFFNDKTLDTAAGQTTAYDHLFFCRSFSIIQSTQMINGRTFSITGIDLYTKTIRAKESSGSTSTAVFTTKAINLALTVINTLNTYCVSNAPVATVQIKDVTQTSFTVTNLELRQCNEGTLMADIEVIRGIQDQYGQFTHLRSEWQKGVQLGVIGCDPSCMFCNGTTSSDCIVCADQTQMLFMGQCYATCPSSHPYFMYDSQIIQRQQFITHDCVDQCPLGYYPDPQTMECMECNTDCQTCSNNYIASCLTCEPVAYLFNGICLQDCPSPHHQNNFTSYKCDQISDTTYLKVKIQSLGYKTKIPKDVQAYLKASISNEGGGQILSILWEQLEPNPVSDDVTIFSSTPGGDVLNRDSVIKLKMTAFNYMSSDQVVKVKVTVQNSVGETAYDIYEFYQNQPPSAGNSTITVINNVGYGGGMTVDSIFRMTLNFWDDTIQHGEDPIKYKIYMIVNSVYYSVTDYTFSSDIYYRLPLIVSDPTDTSLKTIQICVQCTDFYEANTIQCQKFYNVTNRPNYILDYNALTAHLQTLNFTQNMTNVIYAANLMFQAMQSPKRTSSSPGLCSLDYHCNFNGVCTSQYGNQRCVCDLGYSGTFCQFSDSQFYDLQNIANSLVQNLYLNITNKYEIKPNDVEIVGSSLRGVLKDPDLLSDDNFEKAIQIVELIGNAPIYAHFPVNQNVRQIFLDALSAVMQKMYHSSKVRRGLPAGQALAQGYSLDIQYQQSQTRNLIDQEEYEIMSSLRNLQEDIIYNEFQPYLIGGTQNKKKQGRKLQQATQSSNSNGPLYEQWARRIDLQLNNFIEKFIPTLNPDNIKFTYTTRTFELTTFTQLAPNYKGQTMFISEKDLYWQFPLTIFNNVQGSASDKHYVCFKALKYNANPFIFESNPGGFVESNVTDLSFYDLAMNHINISLQNTYLMVKEPYQKTQAYQDELMRCMTWDNSQNSFINDNSCSVSKIYEDIPCYSCDEDAPLNVSITVCRCTHMSRFAVVYEQTYPSTGVGVQIGIYSDFFAMQYWRNSFGLYAVMVGSITFAVGHILMFLLDRSLQPKVMAKLKERIRKLELKGFQQKPTVKKLTVKRDFDGKIIFKRHKVEEEKKEESKPLDAKLKDKQSALNEDEIESTPVTQLKKPTLSKKPIKKPLNNKKFNKDDDMIQEAELIPAKSKGKKPTTAFNPNSSKSMQGLKEKDYEEDHMSTERGGPEDLAETKGDMSKVDNDIFEQQMLRRYEEEKEIYDFVKKHGTSSSEEDMGEKMRSKEQKKYLKMEKKAREMYTYHWKTLLIHGNHVTSILYVTSLLSPRHARWTLLFTCIFLNWFWCAVIYNNTKDPLSLPDFDRSARSIAGDDLWISIVAPMGTIILMYVFAGIFKVSDQRLVQSYTMIYLEQMLVELKKEMKLRFIIAYMITIAIYAAITWYVIKFSSTFGWKVSWTWFYSGIFAILLQFIIYDNFISIIHWITYYCSRTLALFWMKVRILKQAKSEG